MTANERRGLVMATVFADLALFLAFPGGFRTVKPAFLPQETYL